jgi:hypothetical protein
MGSSMFLCAGERWKGRSVNTWSNRAYQMSYHSVMPFPKFQAVAEVMTASLPVIRIAVPITLFRESPGLG